MGDIGSWLEGIGFVGALFLIGAVVFAESGLLIGLFLPGDTLLFTAGFFAAQGKLPIAWVMAVIFIGAVLGDNMGFFFGQKAGPRVFTKKRGIFFRREYAERARKFYNLHGGKTVMFARFIPYARTFAPIVAGAAKMRHIKFIIYNIIGALVWTVSFVLLGYWLGVKLAEQIEQYLVPALLFGIMIVFGPTIIYFIRHRQVRAAIVRKLKESWHKN